MLPVKFPHRMWWRSQARIAQSILLEFISTTLLQVALFCSSGWMVNSFVYPIRYYSLRAYMRKRCIQHLWLALWSAIPSSSDGCVRCTTDNRRKSQEHVIGWTRRMLKYEENSNGLSYLVLVYKLFLLLQRRAGQVAAVSFACFEWVYLCLVALAAGFRWFGLKCYLFYSVGRFIETKLSILWCFFFLFLLNAPHTFAHPALNVT